MAASRAVTHETFVGAPTAEAIIGDTSVAAGDGVIATAIGAAGEACDVAANDAGTRAIAAASSAALYANADGADVGAARAAIAAEATGIMRRLAARHERE